MAGTLSCSPARNRALLSDLVSPSGVAGSSFSAPGTWCHRANGLWVIHRHSAAGRNRKVLTLSSAFMPVFAGVMTSLCFLLTYVLVIRREAKKVGAEIQPGRTDESPEGNSFFSNPTVLCLAGALVVTSGVFQVARAVGYLAAPLWAPGNASENTVVVTILLVVFSATAILFQFIWVRTATKESGLGPVEARQCLHRRNPMFVSAP